MARRGGYLLPPKRREKCTDALLRTSVRAPPPAGSAPPPAASFHLAPFRPGPPSYFPLKAALASAAWLALTASLGYPLLNAFSAGSAFGLGLASSGLNQPHRVLNFLNPLCGHWDPTLLSAFSGAVVLAARRQTPRLLPTTTAACRRLPPPPAACLDRTLLPQAQAVGNKIFAACGRRPALCEHSSVPGAKEPDAQLLLGSALFGVGWGLGGMCPGPAIANLSSGAPRRDHHHDAPLPARSVLPAAVPRLLLTPQHGGRPRLRPPPARPPQRSSAPPEAAASAPSPRSSPP